MEILKQMNIFEPVYLSIFLMDNKKQLYSIKISYEDLVVKSKEDTWKEQEKELKRLEKEDPVEYFKQVNSLFRKNSGSYK
jgi:hypothetical protein